MNNEKNRNYQRIDKLLITAFIDLCRKENASNISVSMVCKTAEVNRSTFYNHFNDIWEIIEVIEDEIMVKINSIFNSFTFKSFVKNPYLTLSKINNLIEENPKYYQTLFEVSESRFFMDKLKNILMKKILQDQEFLKRFNENGSAQGAASFFVGGLANVYSDWFNKKINCSLTEIVEPMSRSIVKYFASL